MRHTIKAVLLSALVFPGTGHFALKKPMQGTILVTVTLACLYFLFSAAMDISQELSGKIQANGLGYDKEEVTQLVTEKLSAGEYQFVSISVILLIIIWVFAIFDSFRIGRSMDNVSSSHKEF